VLEGTHGAAIRPNHVYVIPPNANLAVADGLL
jgi:chemotaxis response regulator CheB